MMMIQMVKNKFITIFNLLFIIYLFYYFLREKGQKGIKGNFESQKLRVSSHEKKI